MRAPPILTGIVVFAASISGACSILPSSGPSSGDVRSAGPSESEVLPYAVVRITPDVERVLARYSPRIAQAFTDRRGPNEIRFGIGDVVSVTVFESAAGGLFIPLEAGVRPGNYITLPNQSVDNSGNITVPYAGTIRARGRTVVEVQQAIVDALKPRALEPQVVVALVEQRASSISVLGDVVSPVRFPANAAGERVLDAIARAGGPRSPGFDTKVLLERAGRQATVPFGALIYEPTNNIYVRPQDTIYVYREPQTFLSFGASGTQGQFPFDAWRLTLAEAMAKAGGLNDSLADPSSVFLYRGEPRSVAELLGVDCTRFSGPVVPIIYNLNLRDPSGYFLATQFDMHNKDVVFASNAAAVEGTKFLTYIRLISATVNDPIITAINAYTVKNLAQGVGNVAVVTTTASAPVVAH
jgi:polysaccharide export outer membrane protein